MSALPRLAGLIDYSFMLEGMRIYRLPSKATPFKMHISGLLLHIMAAGGKYHGIPPLISEAIEFIK